MLVKFSNHCNYIFKAMPIHATNPLGFKANVIRSAKAGYHMIPKDMLTHWVDERPGAAAHVRGLTHPNA